MNRQQFQRAAQLSDTLAARWYPHVASAAAEFEINTPVRLAMWLAQMGHESAGFTELVESFNYRVDALAIFSRIPAQLRGQLGRQTGESTVPLTRQRQIANLAYGGRFGNGGVVTGDGWRYRGRGLKQITFKDNYRACAAVLGLDLVAHPELLEQDGPAARSAGWFWQAHGCNALADAGDFAGTTRQINPAMAGQGQREVRWKTARQALGA